MGTAGLNVKRLAGLLERKKVDCDLIEGDSAYDHCVLRLTSHKLPGLVGILQYENQGSEPRLVGLTIENSDPWDKALELRGDREDDPAKIVEWLEQEFLKS